MKASAFIAEVKQQHGVSIVIADGKVKVPNARKLPRYLKVAIVQHRPSLLACLADGTDTELDQQHYNDDELMAFGCRQILAEEVFHNDGSITQRWTWTSDEGDEHFEKILVGLLDAGDVVAERKQAEHLSREMEFSAKHPPRGRLFGRRFRFPGL